MDDTSHLDEVETLRVALWGAGAELTEGAAGDSARHAAACRECGDAVAYHRRVRDTFRRWADSEVTGELLNDTQEIVRLECALPEISWLPAIPVMTYAGVRGAATSDLHVACDAGEIQVDLLLHPSGAAGRYALSGQLLHRDATPADDLAVALFVDRRLVASATTDGFGEFSFDAAPGEKFGLRIGSGEAAKHVEIHPERPAR